MRCNAHTNPPRCRASHTSQQGTRQQHALQPTYLPQELPPRAAGTATRRRRVLADAAIHE